MLELTSVAGSDDWWLMRLGMKLGEGLPRLGKLKRYREGDAVLPEQVWEGARTSYVEFLKRNRLHVVETISAARTNRQRVVGFRTAANGDDLGDKIAWDMWKRASMPVNSLNLFSDKADYGEAFVTVTGSSASGTGAFAGMYAEPTMVVSDGWSTAVETNAIDMHRVDATLKVGYDPILGVETAILLRPGYMRIAYRRTLVPTLPNDGSPWMPGTGWTWASEPMPLNFTRANPTVRFATKDGLGVWEKHIDSIDRVNEKILHIATIIAMQAFRQRAVESAANQPLPDVYPPEHPLAGQRIDYDELFKSGPAALWLLPPGAKLWESTPTDNRPESEALDKDLKYLMAVTSTPHYVLSADGANQSAQGAALSREMLAFEVNNMNERDAASLSEVMSLAFQARRDTSRADAAQIETMWAPVDRASIAERAAAAKDAKQGGATQRWIDEHVLEMTPAEMQRARTDRDDEAFEAATLAGSSGGPQ